MNTISTPVLAFWNQPYSWLIVLAIIVLLFGGSKLPSLAKGLGQSIREFKKATEQDDDDDDDDDDDAEKTPKKITAKKSTPNTAPPNGSN